MSFDQRCDHRWQSVLLPALSDAGICGRPLTPRRVDLSHAGNSILTEILALVTNSLLVVADITALDELNRRPVRNANVLYEVGLAHATRLPEEVLLFRSDASSLDFDVANVRVHPYDPDGDPAGAIRKIISTARDSLTELGLRRRLAIERAREALDPQTFLLLSDAIGDGIRSPALRTVGNVLEGGPRLAAIRRLLDFGAIRAKFMTISADTMKEQLDGPTESLVTFHATAFGLELFTSCFVSMGALQSDVRESILRHIETAASAPHAG